MKRSRFSDEQIIGILKEHEAGAIKEDGFRRHGTSEATFYKWEASGVGGAGTDPTREPTLSRSITRRADDILLKTICFASVTPDC